LTPEQSEVNSQLFTPLALSHASQLDEIVGEAGHRTSTPRENLNRFLVARDVSPIRTSMTSSWDIASERTKRRYISKGKLVALAALEELAPTNSEMLLSAIKSKGHESEWRNGFFTSTSIRGMVRKL
jgi:hypothetical protein